jgi:diacylglycerol O-acyltransferase / wax synthase
MQQLSGLDASFLYMETGAQFGHVGSLTLYDPREAHEGSLYLALRRTLPERLHLLPPFRRRIVEVPFGLDHPYWIEDPNFDLDFHMRHIAVPPPGSNEQLAELVSHLHASPLDRSRPLWQLWVIEGLESGQTALYIKVHHCTIDGVSGVEMTSTVLDRTREGGATPPEHGHWTPEPIPGDGEMFARGLGGMLLQPGKAVRFAIRTARDLPGMAPLLAPVAEAMGLGRLPWPLGPRRTEQVDAPRLPQIAAPRTSFNRSITPHRRFAFITLSLADARRVRKAFGTTLNDVVMALCAGALRRYLEERGELPDEALVASVPVSVRSETEKATYSNRVTAVMAELATDEPDPVKRLRRIHEAMRSAKQMQEAIPATLLQDFTQFATPALFAQAARIAARLRIADRMRPPFNLIISNVPGPREPLYCGGAQMRTYYPVSAVAEGQGLNITVQSYLDQLDFGVITCRELVSDPWKIARYLGEALEELSKLAGREAQ